MNSTKCEVKCRKPSNRFDKKGFLDEIGSVNRAYARVYVSRTIDENNDTVSIELNTNQSLLERVLERKNLSAAYFRVHDNKGAAGVDGLEVDQLLDYLQENKESLLGSIREGKYKPAPVRRVEIPKDEPGKFRVLGIPTVVDRVIQQGIAQVLTPIYEYAFSEYSYGFRPDRDCHMALMQVQDFADEGYVYAADIDISKYFDTVTHSKLIQIISETIKDGELISLIHKYLRAGAIQYGMFYDTEEGVPQGGPLSPLLGNIYLNELDQELTRRGHKFVRYADDVLILCKSERAAERTMESVTRFIEEKLFLTVNREKSKVVHLKDVKYLGYGFYFKDEECRLRVHEKSIAKFKNKMLYSVLARGRWSNEMRLRKWNQKVRGWVRYFRLADAKSLMKNLDGWARRHLRALTWRQWKRVRTRYKNLRHLGVTGDRLHKLANMRVGPWRAALVLGTVLTNQVINHWGYCSMSDYYAELCQN